jgi:hypothetical protein
LDEILEGLIEPSDGAFPGAVARYVLGMRFTEVQAARYEALVEQTQDATLPPVEREELEAFVTANTLLMILKSKARRSVAREPSAA